MNNTKSMRFVPSMDTTDEKAAKEAAYYAAHYGDCYMCKNHIRCVGVCRKTGCALHYPIRGCLAKESNR